MVINYLQSKFNKLKKGTIYKALRNKDIRVNGTKISENVLLYSGDELTVYITDEFLYGGISLNEKDIVYEDENVVIIYKGQNMLVVSQGDEQGLDVIASNYFGYTVYPCHRIDRNTSGLVIFAKNHEVENLVFEMIRNHSITKLYRCTVFGKPKARNATLVSYLFKDSKNSHVIISDEKKPGYMQIITKYKVLKYNKDNTTDLEVELVTGKTHQIRAHLASIGHPIIGDGKYGINEVNKQHGVTWQKLEAYKIVFNDAWGKLEYLKGKEVGK